MNLFWRWPLEVFAQGSLGGILLSPCVCVYVRVCVLIILHIAAAACKHQHDPARPAAAAAFSGTAVQYYVYVIRFVAF